MTAGRIALLAAGEDRLVALLRPVEAAALAAGLAVDVIATSEAQRADAAAAGARAIPFAASGGLNLIGAGDAAGRLAAVFRSTRPDLVHAIGLRGAILAGSAAVLGGVDRRVYGPTGLGDPAAGSNLLARGTAFAARTLLRGPLAGRRTRFLLESEDEARALGFAATEPTRIVIAGRASPDLAEAAVALYRVLLADSAGHGYAERSSP